VASGCGLPASGYFKKVCHSEQSEESAVGRQRHKADFSPPLRSARNDKRVRLMPKSKPRRGVSKIAKLSPAEAQRQLDSFLDKYDPKVAAFARRALSKMRKLVPGAIEMVYDNYNWLVIGFSPSERPSEAIFSIVMPPGKVTLCFLQGAGLPDPAKRLTGSGNVVRNIRIYEAGEPDGKVLDDPEVLALINTALNRAKVPMPAKARRKLIIRSVSAKQRPRCIPDTKLRKNSPIT
jgi:hypothetical protein